ncbi:MAG TPA: hypothetical protein VLL08_16895 [Kineosporiaceae bacterium]|nr:hypothetical protein [Kineosporiaceae bacterium]
MDLDWDYFRRLYKGLFEPDDHAGVRRYLQSQLQTATDHLSELSPLRTRELLPPGGHTGSDEQLSRIMKLYALSRVSDWLVESIYQAGEAGAVFSGTDRPWVHEQLDFRGSESDARTLHLEFLSGIGLTVFEHAHTFSPFHHEIVAVVQDPTAATVTVEEILWPGFSFGDLLFSRAGVRVRAPQHLIDATAATTSKLYFTHRRHPRPTDDCAVGWGSNSQWATSFDRFYADQEGLHFNWDGPVDIGDDPPLQRPGVPPNEDPLDERREVLLHRCFVTRRPLPNEFDRWPYEDRLSIKTSEWPLKPESIVHVPWTR